jgi:hypothetical protein
MQNPRKSVATSTKQRALTYQLSKVESYNQEVGKIKVLLLSEQETAELLSIEEVMEAVENAFREKALAYAQMPPKVYLNFPKYNGARVRF